MIQLHCPRCRHEFLSADEAGAAAECPECGYRWSTARAAAAAPPALATKTDTALELPAGLPDAVYELGSPRAVYAAPDSFAAGLIGRLIAVAIGLVVFGASTHALIARFHTLRQDWGLMGLCCMLPFVLGGGWVLLKFLPTFESMFLRAVLAFPDRLVVVRWPGRFTALRWDDIVSVRQDVIARGLLFSWDLAYVCTLRDRKGRRVRLKSSALIAKPGAEHPMNQILESRRGRGVWLVELGRLVREETGRRLLPAELAAFRAGDSVRFGPLAVDRHGLVEGERSTPWQEVERLVVEFGRLTVVRKSGESTQHAVAEIDNLHVLLDLLGEVRLATVEVKSWVRPGWSKRGMLKNPEGYHALVGSTAVEKGDYELAFACCSEAIRLGPDNQVARRGRALAYAATGDYDRAIADLDEQIKAVLLEEAPRPGEKPKSAAPMMPAAEPDPLSAAGAYYTRGLMHRKKGDRERAVADFTESIRLLPGHPAAYRQRGEVYEDLGDAVRAQLDRVKALGLSPAPDSDAPPDRPGGEPK